MGFDTSSVPECVTCWKIQSAASHFYLINFSPLKAGFGLTRISEKGVLGFVFGP